VNKASIKTKVKGGRKGEKKGIKEQLCRG